ncbi:MAG: 2-hydroxychromene-2-carboxylate isomerase [Betaproteobacteria bacterium]|nr:2-hydroxychromene-2-carboxylate isomerase [Betaproteobacteria bacterium]
MTAPIDFYFDFSSPYGYLAATRIDAIAAKHGRDVMWRPILLGAVFKINGQQPLTTIPLKGGYATHDMLRSARWFNVPFRIPRKFPINTVAPCRAYYWLFDKDAALAKKFAGALYRAYFAEDRDISTVEITLEVAATLGIDTAALAIALNDPAVKERTKMEVDAAIERGVFGSPYIVIDGEPFWGADRLDQMERWLDKGPW